VTNVLSRRDFGKNVSMTALGGLALGPMEPLAQAQGNSAQIPKRMTSVLREMINKPGVIAAPGIYDVITARTAERVGFRALDLPGSALGYATCMMEPNLTLTDMVETTRAITDAVNIPVVVDVGAGFGEPAHVVHMVHLLEKAGAAGIHLEDQIYPKRFHYHTGQEHTIELEPWLAKIRYALQARSDPDFVIVARTDAFKTVSFAEGIRRSNLAFEAGAHMIMPSHIENLEQIKQLPKEINGPMNWTHGFGLSLKQLEDMGTSKGRYKLVNYVGGPIQWSYKAVRDGLMNLKQTGDIGMDPAVWAPITKEIQELSGLPAQIAIENATTEKG
jgi:2-methylisocitrate lyase-like PEP mutase family enzyme